MAEYTTPKAFYDLYYDFTGYTKSDYPQDRTAIAQDLAKVVAETTATESSSSPLVVADSKGIYVYSEDKNHQLIASASYRAAPNSGFYELTSLSHVGPAIAYLGALKSMGDDSWEKHLGPMIEHLTEVRELNKIKIQGDNHWLNQLSIPALEGKEELVKNMVDYGCSLAANYLISVKENKDDFSSEHVIENFLNVGSEEYPVSFDTVMIGTFACVGLMSVYELYKALSNTNIDWQNAKIILHNLAGTNYGSGLTAGSNWLVPVIQSIAGEVLDSKRILILPYAELPESLGSDYLPEKDFENLSNRVWGGIYARPFISQAAFSHVDDIKIPYREPLPGDYGFTQADQIEHFVQRLKFSITSPKQMLSNTVGFWLAGEAVAKQWQFDRVELPGLTKGFPSGMSAYPVDAPAIRIKK
ncbi:DUF5624 domain-containing protein [Francisella adeliensis]|uniref:DUF5624 domain-containing protein n=1 Tax=Francisella adeliensis TaxID=2007306 RepID=A0A2Z4XX00_9GAMM|nr:DUF5624 domain-containing protein [Francisella adeliensis]AXA33417.1 hypothetical protein CDH04_02855 [Francisella adeliensis]MBK2085434.1 DUF5624 domain-containing protein [Francisella adeliensis]MBK2097164.1 DUF5624 domain-containing protein [Francisella adeliensis]QIW11645.1 hypothetical protein FZC43_02855 [Francisella adeliensis]QIW13520.1 hypothetical protein FZC44_02855 [Francisella adeliensis]